jgi:hypothetical protein
VYHSGQIAILSPGDRRLAVRRMVNFGASVREAGSTAVNVKVSDLAPEGCELGIDRILPPGTEIWLKVTGLAPVRAHIVWSRDREAGCQFATPLDRRLLEELASHPRRVSNRLIFGRRGAAA